jgi:hypothetical protein
VRYGFVLCTGGTLRLKLLKVGTVVVRNTRRVRLWFSSAFPLQEVFRQCVARFSR